MRRLVALALTLVAGAFAVAGCSEVPVATPEALASREVRIATTTNFITDLARRIGGDRVRVTGLMGPGVDPHMYKASAGDVKTLAEADLVLYGGLELEGKMADVFERLAEHRPTLAVTRDIPRSQLLASPQHPDKPDPHVWFDVTLWERAARTTAAALAELDPGHADEYRDNLRDYLGELRELDAYAKRRLGEIPARSRVLVTSHDAFRYFGRRYGLEVVAIQGISTATEATTADVERVAARDRRPRRALGLRRVQRAGADDRRGARLGRRPRRAGAASARSCSPTPPARRARPRAPTSGWSAPTSTRSRRACDERARGPPADRVLLGQAGALGRRRRLPGGRAVGDRRAQRRGQVDAAAGGARPRAGRRGAGADPRPPGAQGARPGRLRAPARGGRLGLPDHRARGRRDGPLPVRRLVPAARAGRTAARSRPRSSGSAWPRTPGARSASCPAASASACSSPARSRRRRPCW